MTILLLCVNRQYPDRVAFFFILRDPMPMFRPTPSPCLLTLPPVMRPLRLAACVFNVLMRNRRVL